MKAVLNKTFRDMISDTPGSLQGRYREQINSHDDIAREHFLKYCDSGTCIRGRAFVISALNKGWHEGACLECAFNPYNMTVEDSNPPAALSREIMEEDYELLGNKPKCTG